eukprot:8373671-Alexandrium_andersonii.AAC.1
MDGPSSTSSRSWGSPCLTTSLSLPTSAGGQHDGGAQHGEAVDYVAVCGDADVLKDHTCLTSIERG